jgi:hypothetical protein
MLANIKIKFVEDPPDPSHHFTVDGVYQVLATSPYEDGLVGMAVLNDNGVLKSIRSDDTAFELVSITVPGDNVQIYP